MSESMPNFWWCPTHHLYRGGEERPCPDAEKLVSPNEIRAVIFEFGQYESKLTAIDVVEKIDEIVNRGDEVEQPQTTTQLRYPGGTWPGTTSGTVAR